MLKEYSGGRGGIRFTDAERCRLARKARILGRKVLNELHYLGHTGYPLAMVPRNGARRWNYSHRRGPALTVNHRRATFDDAALASKAHEVSPVSGT
jgi:hypothetical protein